VNKSRLAAISVVTVLTVGAAIPAVSEKPPTPAQPVPPGSNSQASPYRSSIFVGAGFYSGQAERAGSLRGRASTLGHASFASPEEAVSAFIAALETTDDAALDAMLGPGNRDQLSTGNKEADTVTRTQFLQAYRAKHALAPRVDGSLVLEVGDNAWPLPVPIVATDGKWYLDGAASANEITYRSIGHSELGAIAVCRGFIDAQKAYAAVGHDGHDPGIFASKLISDPGQHNGLQWGTVKGEPPSPAFAPVTGIPYVPGIPKKLLYDLAPQPSDPQKPFHGYYYRMLFAQGANAKGGAAEYVVDGELTRGIALVAWPAVYGASGVMSFLVNRDGIVYQKDLGADTASLAENIRTFDPDSSWSIVENKDNNK
jgi:hypothetical protein